MDSEKPEFLHKDLTDKIIKCFYEIYKGLGFGFLEKVYRNAMMIVLAEKGLEPRSEQPIRVFFKNTLVGYYQADITVNGLVLVELKAIEKLAREHELQLINYLKATSIEVGLLLNFGRKPEIRRKIFSNNRKLVVPGDIDRCNVSAR